jgi:YVTN family beta-propeller protein
MDVRLLGPFEVWEGDDRLPVGSGKQAALLALLALRRGEACSNDRLVDALWDGSPPPTAPKNVQIYVSQLRKTLGESVIETRGNGYALALDRDQVDTARFEAVVERGRKLLAEGDHAAAAATLAGALALWRGPALVDFAYADFAQREIARLEEVRLGALEDRIDADLALGGHRQVVPELESLVRDHPLRERPREQLMLALYRDGRQADALDVYHDARRRFVEELGIEPGRSLQALQQRILRQDEGLEAPPRPRVPRVPKGYRQVVIAVGVIVLAAVAALAVRVSRTGAPHTLHSVSLNAVGVIDPRTNDVVAQVPVGVNPSGIAVEGGRVWVANEADGTLSEIDGSSRSLIRTIPLDGAATGVTASAGFVWVLNAATPENTSPPVEITKIDPRLGLVVDRVPTDLVYGDVLEGLLAVDRGSAWVPSPLGDSPTQTIERIDLLGHRVTGRYPIFGPRRAAAGITYGDGAVWFLDARGLIRLDPATGNIQLVTVQGGGGLAVGHEAVWVGARFAPGCLLPECKSKPGYVAKVDLGARTVEGTTPAADPISVAVSRGSVWVANRQTKNVERIDPTTNNAIATIPLRNTPSAIAVGAGAVWVVVG